MLWVSEALTALPSRHRGACFCVFVLPTDSMNQMVISFFPLSLAGEGNPAHSQTVVKSHQVKLPVSVVGVLGSWSKLRDSLKPSKGGFVVARV